MTARVTCGRCGWESPPASTSAARYWVGVHAVSSGCPVGEIHVPDEVTA
jgi:hypothetical protein